ncbi:hypothetical protein TL16_g05798 [Triparma laevis f. inornata]|uniref:Uncharacterized protein n=2 Tax=Triparma laevis TaxID=1534972 RepID=A0A9W7FQR6_9STRA|nr:hypothetical protein TL16_g05798 [Triparma laevis f. inornata]GMI17259.1 hypothetical protein TrLO_g13402 [Triparma laevis f. longispina]
MHNKSPFTCNDRSNQNSDAEEKASKRAAAKLYAQSLTAQIQSNTEIKEGLENVNSQIPSETESQLKARERDIKKERQREYRAMLDTQVQSTGDASPQRILLRKSKFEGADDTDVQPTMLKDRPW